jgi:hypothetical protein
MDSSLEQTCKTLITQFTEQMLEGIKAEQSAHIKTAIDEMKLAFEKLEASQEKQLADALKRRMFIPNLAIASHVTYNKFMGYSTCSTADFFHPRYAEICAMFKQPTWFHRKIWEWVFVIHKLQEAGVLNQGMRGIAFGVGQEKLPALFASFGASVVATDAPPEIGAHWNSSKEYSDSLEKLRFPEIVSNQIFDQNVSFQQCDMKAIDDDLTEFDFAWSSCCFEHLGSLEAGMQFVIDSVEKTLKVGGIACHTTEFNLSSDEYTMERGETVIYRRKDMVNLVERLRALGHEVEPFVIAPDSHFMDYHLDVPPYSHEMHLKLKIGEFVATSAGIVITKR